jgi:uncharacterized membrane protein YbaN (DUF454 family)
MNADLGDVGRSASFLEAEGVLVVRDRTLFRPGFEGFCRTLAESAVGLGGVRSAFVCLASGICRLEFEGGRFSAPEMAEWFAEAVRIASGRGPGEVTAADDRGGWISLRIEPGADHGASWETTLEGRGTFRLRHPGLVGRRDLARAVASELAEAPGVDSCRLTFWGGDLHLRFNREEVCSSEALGLAERAYRRSHLEAPGLATPEVATGLQRLGYLALAGGSFAMTAVGLAIPGVPTVPFLLATSYFLVRSSPSWNEKLLGSKFFGPILSDLEIGHGLQRTNKIKLIALSLAIPLVTIVVIVPGWPLLLLMLTVTSAGLFAISRIPGLPEIAEDAQPGSMALNPAS